MGYVIGSQKGKDIAKSMKTGETYKASDGSTWTKKSDGSVSVTTKSGNTYDNAYTSSSSSSKTSSGGSSSKSSGSSNKNSQYTGSSTSIKTNNSTQQTIKDQMNANSIAWWNADDAEKQRLKEENQRLAALLGGSVSYDPGTGTWSGTADGADVVTKDDILDWEYKEEKPEYESKYDPRMDALLSEILNRGDFSYDAMNDPLYQQYAAMYRREGDRAMKETMAEAAAGAGGMNTYAITAAQQANNYYNSQLNDKIPQLYQLAYEMYLKDKESKVQDLGLLLNMDNAQYNRYRDTMSDYYNDKSFAYGAYQDAVQQGNWQTNFDYNAMLDNRNFDYNDMWANKEWDTKRGDVEYERNQEEQEKAYAQIMDWIKSGVTSFSPELIAKAGLTQEEVNLLITAAQAQQGIGGRASTGSGYNNGGYKGGNDNDGYIGAGNGNNSGSVTELGIGPVSNDTLETLARVGAIVGDENGNLYWADGWNASNYKARLNSPNGFGGLF